MTEYILPKHRIPALIAVIVIVLVMCGFIQMIFFPGVPVKIDRIIINEVRNGDYFSYTPIWEKTMNRPADITRSFRRIDDGMRILMPAYVGNMPPGKYGYPVRFKIDKLPPGWWQYEVTVTIQVNPISIPVSVTKRSEKFYIN